MNTKPTMTVYSRITRERLRRLLNDALEEDVGSGDLTTELLVPGDLRADAHLLVKQEGVLAGSEVFVEVFALLDSQVKIELLLHDGDSVVPGSIPVRMSGLARHVLTAERTALNFLQKMSGVATITSRLVSIASQHGVRINHIRKTTPLLRALEVYAVRVGGGSYNRFGLFDGILIKDNHLEVAAKLGIGIQEVVAQCKSGAPLTTKLGLEVNDLSQLPDAIDAQPDYLVLDNMNLTEIEAAVKQVRGRIPIDVTGGVGIDNLAAIAATGIDMVGVGAITHSAPSLDMSLELEFR